MATRTQIASDTFTYSNGSLASVSGGNWTQLKGTGDGTSLQVVSNQITPSHFFGAEKTYRWTGTGTFTADQYASLALGTLTNSGGQIGVICRPTTDTEANRDYYYAYYLDQSPNAAVYGKLINGTLTQFFSGTGIAWVSGDRISLEVEGTSPPTLRVCRNEVPLGGSFTTTDTVGTALTGSLGGGLWGTGDSNVPTGDNWTAGNLTAAAGGILYPAHFTGKFQDFTGGIS
jgi:hypothetical protein